MFHVHILLLSCYLFMLFTFTPNPKTNPYRCTTKLFTIRSEHDSDIFNGKQLHGIPNYSMSIPLKFGIFNKCFLKNLTFK